MQNKPVEIIRQRAKKTRGRGKLQFKELLFLH